MSIWGIGTAIIGVVCYCIGLVHGAICGRLHSAMKKPQPETRHMELVEPPAPEDTRPQWEREMDEAGEQAWRNWA